jgi:hypothetical protein
MDHCLNAFVRWKSLQNIIEDPVSSDIVFDTGPPIINNIIRLADNGGVGLLVLQ